MFYEIFFGIVFGVTMAIVLTAGLLYFFYWATGGKANFEKMEKRAEAHRKQVEERLNQRRT